MRTWGDSGDTDEVNADMKTLIADLCISTGLHFVIYSFLFFQYAS